MSKPKSETPGYNVISSPLASGKVDLTITNDDGDVVFEPEKPYGSEKLARQAALRWIRKQNPEMEPVEVPKKDHHHHRLTPMEVFQREVDRLTKLADDAQARADKADLEANQHRGISKSYRVAADALKATIGEEG